MKTFAWLFLGSVALGLLVCPMVTRAASDDTDDETDEDTLVTDEPSSTEGVADEASGDAATSGEAERSLASPFVKTNILFVQPESTSLPAGRLVKLLVGFYNNGSTNFQVDAIDGSFHYPQDYSYTIQNFSMFEFNKVIEAEREATFQYLFTPSETFSSRQFGLTIKIHYRNYDGTRFYFNTVFNDTVSVIEPDDGLDGETFFLYIFIAALVVLLAIAAQQFFSAIKKKARSSSKSKFTGSSTKTTNGVASTQSTDGVDYAWIPKEHLPKDDKSPRSSPRQRKVRPAAGSASGNSSNDE